MDNEKGFTSEDAVKYFMEIKNIVTGNSTDKVSKSLISQTHKKFSKLADEAGFYFRNLHRIFSHSILLTNIFRLLSLR